MYDPSIYYGIGFAAFVVTGAVTVSLVNVVRLRRRRERLRQWAMQHGYDFRAERIPARQLAPMAYLTASRHVPFVNARNVMRRSRLALFDLIRGEKTLTGRASQVRRATCALFALDKPLPTFSFTAFTAEPKLDGVLEMARQLAVPEMLPIDGRPGFFVRSQDVARVQPLFAGGRAQFFDDKIGWSAEAEDSWLLIRSGYLGPAFRWLPLPYVSENDYERFISIAQSIHDYFVPASFVEG
jgi:hypothetical protein